MRLLNSAGSVNWGDGNAGAIEGKLLKAQGEERAKGYTRRCMGKSAEEIDSKRVERTPLCQRVRKCMKGIGLDGRASFEGLRRTGGGRTDSLWSGALFT